jgi:hypothetical protein
MDDAAGFFASDIISLGDIFTKATPAQEGGRRMLYLEASDESTDHQREKVLQSALAESKDYFLRHGNIDISHYTLIGLRHNIPNHLEYEIGKPVEVGFGSGAGGNKTFVKAELYQGANGGTSKQAENAGMVWDSLTKQNPPMSWFPSVGGGILEKEPAIDPNTKEGITVVKKVRWCNIGLDRMPVNKSVPQVSLAPIGVFAKGMGAFVLAKTLTAGYGTDSAALAGGAALRKQSLHGVPANYTDFRERLAKHVLAHREQPLGAHELIDHSINHLRLDTANASEWVERFMRDLHTGIYRSNPT